MAKKEEFTLLPGWITFSLDGRYAYPSSGEVIDVATHQILTTLEDETGRHVASEKLLEIDFQQCGVRPWRSKVASSTNKKPHLAQVGGAPP